MTAGYLADTSALTRMHYDEVRQELAPLIQRGLVSVCAATEFELLFSARDATEYRRWRAVLKQSFPWVPTIDRLWETAAQIQSTLAERGRHRCASVPDLLVAATADQCGLTVLHYDRDFDTIAEVTGQRTQWIVPAGTV